MRAATANGLLPPTLTRAMGHRFLAAPADATVIEAVRLAQVACFGGDAWIARELCRTVLGRSFHDEAFWSAAIRWLSQDAPVAPGDIGHMVDYLRHRRELDSDFIPEARRLRCVWRQIARWQSRLEHTPVQDELLPSSGFNGRAFSAATPGAEDFERWEVTELRTAKEVKSEGVRLRHCVASYIGGVREGTTSIWSLRREGRRKVTIEVSNATRRVVQAKGRANRAPTDRELGFLRAWARASGLQLAPHVRPS